ncbi:cell division control protein Cdc6 [Rhizodiscina lignyota]|uniref:Cell division control protein n=1 Tax=Rhizodiscina lignyota TaxID=1504668 RepID=A0A9P4IJ55_9PEZI|nr:cell division control protein Cdc6 [Rhizodiscina lignyota]
MPSTVLGKRSRPSKLTLSCTDEILTRKTSSKRQSQFVIASDQENANPFITPRSSKRKRVEDGDAMEVDETEQENTPKALQKNKVVASTSPAKHGAPESRVVVQSTRHAKLARADSAINTSSTSTSSPRTPRHRDATAQRVLVTPRHRVGLVGKPLTPHTPRTPATSRSAAPTVYNVARQLFIRSTEPGKLIGRENERRELSALISTRLEKTSSGCIYVSGPPGTGKSALVNEVCSEFIENDSCSQSYVNCMSVKHARDIYVKLLEDFGANDGIINGSESSALKEIFFGRRNSFVVVLDEIDHLLDIDLNLLYALFEWSLDPSSSLILIGIANALDFTDRFLPRLKSRGLKPHLLPFMPYSAAQIASVVTGKLKSLISPTDAGAAGPEFTPFLHPAAIQFLSKKVASATGDLRRAFDIVRRAIDVIETETRDKLSQSTPDTTPSSTPSSTPSKTPLVENINLSSPPHVRSPTKSPQKSVLTQEKAQLNPLAHLTPETAPRATIAHIARLTSAMFNTGATARLQGLNLQQKAVLCALVGCEERARRAASNASTDEPHTPSRKVRGKAQNAVAPTTKELFEIYAKACKKENSLHPLTATEFGDVLAGLETLSLVSAVEGKSGSFATGGAAGTPSRRGRGFGTPSGRKGKEERRVASAVGMNDVKTMLEGTKVGRGILEGMVEGNE